MFGGGGSSNSYIPPIEAPPPPPNPPMFGANAKGSSGQARKTAANQGYGGTILGTMSAPNTSNKTLLGQ